MFLFADGYRNSHCQSVEKIKNKVFSFENSENVPEDLCIGPKAIIEGTIFVGLIRKYKSSAKYYCCHFIIPY